MNSIFHHLVLPAALAGGLLAGAPLHAEDGASEQGLLLRPRWRLGKAYHLQQSLDARTTLPGFGRQVLDWRQRLAVTPRRSDEGVYLELALEVIRVDLNLAGRRSRYYFRPGAEKRFQDPDAEGLQMRMLGRVERLVEHRYHLHLGGGEEPAPEFQVVPPEGRRVTRLRGAAPSAIPWEDLPWHGITGAMLYQGIPEHRVAPGAGWTHRQRFDMGVYGHLNLDLECAFRGLREVKGERLALIEFDGAMDGVFHPDAVDEPHAGMDLKAPGIRGLTLIDPEHRTIRSTVLKIDGRLTSLGVDGAVEGDTAAIRKTLTLTLLTIDDLTDADAGGAGD